MHGGCSCSLCPANERFFNRPDCSHAAPTIVSEQQQLCRVRDPDRPRAQNSFLRTPFMFQRMIHKTCQTLVTCVRQAQETCSEDAKGGRDSLLKETTRLTRLFRNSFSLHLILSMHKTSSVTAFQQHLDSTKSSPPEPKATSTSNPINKNISHPSDVTRDVSTSDPPSAATKIDRWTNKQRRVHAGRVPFPHY